MRRSFLSPMVLLAACATAPADPPPPDHTVAAGTAVDAFACGMRVINELRYTVADADREGGFIRAVKRRASLSDVVVGVATFDQLTLTVYPDADGRTVLRVVPGAIEEVERGEDAGAHITRSGSAQASDDAQRVLQTCSAAAAP